MRCLRPLRRTEKRSRTPLSQLVPLPSVAYASADQRGDRDIFIFSIIDWHFRTQRPQHLARSLAKSGRRVFYFSNHFIDSSTAGYSLERLDPDLSLFQVRLHVNGAPPIYFSPPTSEAEAMLEQGIAKLIAEFGAASSITILQHAYWSRIAARIPNSYRVYDCMDHHEGFGNVPEQLIEIEKDMLRSSDMVIVTSGWLETFAGEYNRNVTVIRNAGEFGHFSQCPTEVFKAPGGRKVIGYYGAIAEWFDVDLIRKLAAVHPDCHVLLVGNDTIGAAQSLSELPNVQFTGEVPYAKLPYYLYAFDVCLLPFQIIPLTMATNPVKVYEYLASGRPVVCVDLPEIAQFGDLVYKAATRDEFVACVTTALNAPEPTDTIRARTAFAAAQTWDHRTAQLLCAIENLPLPKISVVVLTFNNLDLTKACIESLLEETDYPDLEIIVVDNASTDDTPAFLAELADSCPDIRVILNEHNYGFARGNNIGLAAATGDYLVVLNNDTVVTRGWALTLLRHMQRDPSIGLIGPVTNNIGNEAKIDTQYLDIRSMPAEAATYTLSHMGKTIPMKTLAFFCVMMPRAVYETCGPICEEFERGFFEDDDYCRRVEASNYRLVCADDVFIHHHLSASFSKLKDEERQQLFNRNKAIYEGKWGAWEPHKYRRTGT